MATTMPMCSWATQSKLRITIRQEQLSASSTEVTGLVRFAGIEIHRVKTQRTQLLKANARNINSPMSNTQIGHDFFSSQVTQNILLVFEYSNESLKTLFMAGVISKASTWSSFAHSHSECSSGFNRRSIGCLTLTA